MSTLVVSNINDGTTTVPATYVTNGSAKAWVRFNQLTPAITQSFNTSSVTDTSTGDSTANFTSSLNGVNYPCPTNNSFSAAEIGVYSHNTSVSSSRVITRSDAVTNVDRSWNLIQAGDLA